MKVAINRCWGGFSVSKAVYDEMGLDWDGYGYVGSDDKNRADPKLIAAIEKVGLEKASGKLASIEIVEIPDGIEWHIHDYDGQESVRENHRSW